MKRLATLLAALLALSASAGDVVINPDQIRDRQIILGVYVRTVRCMIDSTQAFLRQGVRDSSAITGFTLVLCGSPLRAQLIERSHWKHADAEAFLGAMAERALDEAN